MLGTCISALKISKKNRLIGNWKGGGKGGWKMGRLFNFGNLDYVQFLGHQQSLSGLWPNRGKRVWCNND